MEQQSKAEYYINKIYDWFYQNGYYDANGVAQVCYMLRKIFTYLNQTSDKNIDFDNIDLLKDIFKKNVLDNIHPKFADGILPKELISLLQEIEREPLQTVGKAINKLCKNSLTKPDALPTDDFSVKIMQAFAKNISNNKSFIDICTGTGKLLTNIGSQDIYGREISPEYAEIAKANLFFSNKNYNVDYSIHCQDGLSLGNEKLENSTYLFDPPINAKVSIDNYYNNLKSIRTFTKTNMEVIPSEYAFLYSILNKTISNYVCMFSTNFLTSKEIFKIAFREFLIQNSLLAVISLPTDNEVTNKIILVGSKSRNNSCIYLVTPKTKHINDIQISRIIDVCLRNKKYDEIKDYEIAKIKKVDISELKHDNYLINMPVYTKDEKQPEKKLSLKQISTMLVSSNKSLVNSSKNLETFLKDLNNGVKHIFVSDDKDTDNPANSKEIHKHRRNILKDIIKKYNNNTIDNKRVVSVIFNTYDTTEKECLNDIKYLIKNNRIGCRFNRIFIYKNKQERTGFIFSNLKDFIFKVASNKLTFLSKSQQKFYEYLLDYYLSSKSDEKNDIFIHFKREYQTNDIYINLRVLEILGLISKRHDIEIYDYSNIQEIISSYNLFNNIIKTNSNTGVTEDEN